VTRRSTSPTTMARRRPPTQSGDAAAERFDGFRYALSARARPRSVRALPRLAGSALGLAWRASPRLLVLVASLQFLAALLLGAQVLLSRLVIQTVLDQSESGGPVGPILLPLIGLALTGAMASLLGSGLGQLQRLLAERVQRLSLDSILDVTTQVDLLDFERPEFFDDLQRVKVNAVTRPLTMITGIVQAAGGVITIAGLCLAVALTAPIILPVLPLIGIPLAWLSRRSGQAEFRFIWRTTAERRRRVYFESLLSDRDEAKEIRAFGLAGLLHDRWQDNYDAYLEELEKHVRYRVRLAVLGAFVAAIATAAALGLLAYLIVEGRIELAAAGAAVIAVRLLSTQVQQLFGGIGNLFESGLFLRDLEQFLARAPGNRAVEAGDPPDEFRHLCVENVRFRYPGTDTDVLHDVSIRVSCGEVIALVGDNGSGKTTLAKILAQMFAPTSGKVLWNGRDVRSLDPRRLRDQIGVIFQDFIQYQLSARDNVGFGRPDALGDEERLRSAARSGGADRLIEGLANGFDTVLGKEFYGGQELSGGQWQRVALARVFFRDAPFLVLDEPTAALDARSEREVFQHVRALAEGRSVLFISHRFSTVKTADRIYVLEEGRVIEDGSHDELMTLDGRYAEMFRLQASAYL
jgi:ATP-binding cassette subfamily B protein